MEERLAWADIGVFGGPITAGRENGPVTYDD
jgi:hypothetical protein